MTTTVTPADPDERAVAIAQIVDATKTTAKLSPEDVNDLLTLTGEDLALLVREYRDAERMPDPTAWDVVLKILGACGSLATLVEPIVSAIATVYSIAKS